MAWGHDVSAGLLDSKVHALTLVLFRRSAVATMDGTDRDPPCSLFVPRLLERGLATINALVPPAL